MELEPTHRTSSEFEPFFRQLAALPDGHAPHDWQCELASAPEPRSRVIRIPTGMGKTLGVLAAWAWNRLHRDDDQWPRRLVWCLPMRVLVEQTEQVVREALDRLGLLWDGYSAHDGKIGVHVLMGGVDPGSDWNLFPEEGAVLIGTQDMLLSRALNRGYASGRARWPLEFGLLSHDALWVMDEVQLMDVGLATSAQLQAYHDDDAARGFRPRHTWWMSATLQTSWLHSVDTKRSHAGWVTDPTLVPANRRAEGLGSITKDLVTASVPGTDPKQLANLVLARHQELSDGEYGRITLVICNTVERACSTFDAIVAIAPDQQVDLVHSRFRGAERAGWRTRFLNRTACSRGGNRIVVATQVVEAGVDISAGCVVTDLAPWPSLVQRFGRCARYGGTGAVVVVDRGRDEKAAAPYEPDELEAAQSAIDAIAARGCGVGIAALEEFEDSLDEDARLRLYPYAPRSLLLRRELDELFDTTPDLTGADLDISRFIRSGDERDVLVYWVDVPPPRKGERPHVPPTRKPGRDELCAVPFLRARDWLCGSETGSNRKPRLRPGVRAWTWDWIDGQWLVVDRAKLTPGRVVCVAADVGGYRLDRGFDPTSGPVPPVPAAALPDATTAQIEADDTEDTEALSATAWKTIACHGAEVARTAERIGVATKLPDPLRGVLVLAGRWHDYGKAHPAFQGAIEHAQRPDREDLAKAPPDAWPRPPKTYRTRDGDVRPGLRHELASALALFAVLETHAPRHPALLGPWAEMLTLLGGSPTERATGVPATPCEKEILDCTADEFDLLAYLVAAHHGKVRVTLHAGPKDQAYRDRDGNGLPIRGVREGDTLPSILLDSNAPPVPQLSLTLEPATLGISSRTGRSWRERTLALQERFGPGALAWLEALLIAADRRASRLETSDPLLTRGTDRSPSRLEKSDSLLAGDAEVRR